MFSWLRRSAPAPQPDPVDAPIRASPPLDTSSSPSTAAAPSSTPATAPSSPSASAPAAPAPAAEDARTARNRKKRQQKKKSALRHKRQSTSLAGPGSSDAGDDDDDEREPDDDDVGAPAPEADDDLSYLERIGGLKRQREDKARELAAAAAAAGGGGSASGPAAGAGAGGAAGAAGFGGAASSSAGASGAAGAAGAGAPLRDAFALPGEAPLDTRGVTAGPEQIEAAQLVGEMLRQGKIRPGATGPLNRISGLPDGAGQVNGLDIPSTHELRKTAKENGLVPFTDDRGMLRIGVRVAPDVVLMHPKDGKGEPILLRM